MICEPLRRLDCCLITDRGGVIALTNQQRARDARKKPIRVLGAGESHTRWNITQGPSLTTTAAKVSGEQAFGMAGISPADVDFVQPSDSFTITVLTALEDLGFCEKGEGGSFVEGGRLAPGGDLPAMTSGGGLSCLHCELQTPPPVPSRHLYGEHSDESERGSSTSGQCILREPSQGGAGVYSYQN